MIAHMSEYRPVLVPNEDMQCINTESEHCIFFFKFWNLCMHCIFNLFTIYPAILPQCWNTYSVLQFYFLSIHKSHIFYNARTHTMFIYIQTFILLQTHAHLERDINIYWFLSIRKERFQVDKMWKIYTNNKLKNYRNQNQLQFLNKILINLCSESLCCYFGKRTSRQEYQIFFKYC